MGRQGVVVVGRQLFLFEKQAAVLCLSTNLVDLSDRSLIS